MKRATVALAILLLLTVPAVALGDHPAPGTGSLVVQNGRGSVSISAKGGVIGRIDQGTITIRWDGGGKQPVVAGGATVQKVGANTTRYKIDAGFHFYVGGTYKISIDAIGISLSAVGKGTAIVGPAGFTDPGTYRVNGGPAQPFPETPVKITLGPG